MVKVMMSNRVRDPRGRPGKAITVSREPEAGRTLSPELRSSATALPVRSQAFPTRQRLKTVGRSGLVEVLFPGSGYTSLTLPVAAWACFRWLQTTMTPMSEVEGGKEIDENQLL